MALRAVGRIHDHFDGRAVVVAKSRLETQLLEIAFPSLVGRTLAASEFTGPAPARWAKIAGALRRTEVTHVAGLHLRNTPQSRIVARLTGASAVELNTSDPEERRHKVAQYASIADRVVGEVVEHTPFTLADFIAPRPVADAEVVLAPGSGIVESHKRWPTARYMELIRLLFGRDTSTRFALLGASNESELLESIAAGVKETGATIRVVAGASLRESLALLGRARVVVGGCSGSLHLAALVDAPIIGVYGPTNPGWTGPASSTVRVIRANFECAPCYAGDFIRGCAAPQCMDAVTPGAVVEALDDIEGGTQAVPLHWYPLSRLRVARPAMVGMRRP
jgi:hypothetical protein